MRTTNTGPRTDHSSDHPIEATCPDCHLELTGSKRVEKIKPTDQHRQSGWVFYCPECGRFFTRDDDGVTLHSE